MTQVLNIGANADTSTTPAPEGHDEAMAAKFDQKQQEAAASADTGNTDRPEWLDPKFATPEDMAKAYAELQKKMSSGEKPEDKPAPKADDKPADATTTPADAQLMVEKAGLDFDKVSAEFAEKGELSQETYDALAKGGIPRDTVDKYVAGQQAIANQIRTDVFSTVGGEEAYTEMVQWAKQGLKPAEVDAYNEAMNSGNINTIKLAVDGLKARFTAEHGTPPKLINGQSGNGSQSSGDVFESLAQLTTAMKDPRYASDPAYRKAVTEKLGRSSIM